MSPVRPALVLSLSSLFAVIGPGPGRGQVPAADVAYDATLERSLAAHALGDFAAAEVAMREAHALAPSARTFRGLGVILYSAGRYIEAIAPLEAALASRERPLEAALRASVEELLARVWQRVGRLHLRIEPSHTSIMVDGKVPIWHALENDAAAHDQDQRELLLSPGQHQIRIEAAEHEPYVVTLRSAPGSNDILHVVLARASTGRPLERARPQASYSVPRRPSPVALPWWKPIHRNALLASGATLVVAGGTSWLIGVLRFQKLEKFCERRDGCEENDLEHRYRERRIAPLAITGATIAATGAVALLLAGSFELWQRSEKKRLALGVSFGALRVSGQF